MLSNDASSPQVHAESKFRWLPGSGAECGSLLSATGASKKKMMQEELLERKSKMSSPGKQSFFKRNIIFPKLPFVYGFQPLINLLLGKMCSVLFVVFVF